MIERREHCLAEVHCESSALECGKDAKALMEKISTAEAIVAQELAKMQNKGGVNLFSSTTEHTQVTHAIPSKSISTFKFNSLKSKKMFDVS